MLSLFFSSCTSTPHPGNNLGPEPKNQDDMEDALLFEDFNSSSVTADLSITSPKNITDGTLWMDKNESHVQAFSENGFKEVIVCYALLTEKGQLYMELSLLSDERLQPHLFNYPDSSVASFWDGNEMLDIGKIKGVNIGKWIIHKIKIETNTLNYYKDDELIGSKDIEPDEALTRVSIYTDRNSSGYIGYIIIK
jgi:hypothetical protein